MSNPSSLKPLLLVRPAPQACENTPEYLQRLAKTNGLQSGKEIAAIFGIPISHISRHRPDKILAVINGKDAPETLRLPPRWQLPTRSFGGTVGISLSSRVCPSCLSESDILSTKWSLPLSISCDSHKTVLLDRCPRCLRSIQWNDSVYRCRCGQDFREIDSQPAPSWERSYYELFAPWRIEPSQSVSAPDLFKVEAIAGRVTRRLISTYQQEGKIETSTSRNHPYCWIRSVDHRSIEAICQNNEILAKKTLRLFYGFTLPSQNHYARLTAKIVSVQPRVVRLALQLDTERRRRNQEEFRASKKAKITRPHDLGATLGVKLGNLGKLPGLPWHF